MQFEQRDSGLVVPVETTVVDTGYRANPPDLTVRTPRGEYGEPWDTEAWSHETEAAATFSDFEVHVRDHGYCHTPSDRPSVSRVMARIKLCVNACRGLTDEALERVVSGEFPLVIDYGESPGESLD